MLKLITGPTLEPVTLLEMKESLRELTGDIDSLIPGLIKVGRIKAEGYQNRNYYTQTWELTLDTLPTLPFELGLPPLQSILFIKLFDSEGNITSMDLNDFIIDIDSEPGRIAFKDSKTWPLVKLRSINCFKCQFVTGYNDVNKIPDHVKQAIKLFVTEGIDNPTMVDDIPQAFYSLLDSDRRKPA